jgi:hypothetical protein
VLVFEPGQPPHTGPSEGIARDLARYLLASAQQRAPRQVVPLIEDALGDLSKVQASPIFQYEPELAHA